MATIIRSAHIESEAVTLDIPGFNKPSAVSNRTELPNVSGSDGGDASAHGNRSLLEGERGKNAGTKKPRGNAESPSSEENNRESEELKVLKAQLDEARESLRKARLQFDSEMEGCREKAREEGLAKGQEEGWRAGFEEFGKKAESLARIAESMSRLDAQLLESTEDTLVEIIMESVCKIVGDSLSDALSVRRALTQALSRARGATIGKIRLCPSDYRLIAELPAHEFNHGLESVEFISDNTIEIGGCILESDAGTLDCRLEKQLEQLKVLLLSVRHSHE
ncbi:MAG: FliH/SctL family protein [Pseudomonadota bacterium]